MVAWMLDGRLSARKLCIGHLDTYRNSQPHQRTRDLTLTPHSSSVDPLRSKLCRKKVHVPQVEQLGSSVRELRRCIVS